jgi:heme/copper-type cytochrome/quinol oxidase subunit 1
MHLKLLEPSMFFVQISTVPVRLGNLDQHVLNINTFSFIITNLGILCLVQV